MSKSNGSTSLLDAPFVGLLLMRSPLACGRETQQQQFILSKQ
jgi:hypothetical protein